MSARRFVSHDDECDVVLYDEGAICTCRAASGDRGLDVHVYGEDPDPHDGRLSGPAMDW